MPEGLRTGRQFQARHETQILHTLDNFIGTYRRLQTYEAGIKKGYGYLPNSTNIKHLWYESAKLLHQKKRKPTFVSVNITWPL